MTTYDQTRDRYRSYVRGVDAMGTSATPITPSDTDDLSDPSYPEAITVTAAGNLKVLPLTDADDGSHVITFTNAPVGFVPPFRVRRVFATGTTASVASIDP